MFILSAETALDYAVSRKVIAGAGGARVEELAGGVSCATVRIVPEAGRAVVFKQALPKLRVAADWKCDPARVEREVILLRIARTVIDNHVPAVIDFDPENHTFCMESAPLEAENWKTLLLRGEVSADLAAQCGDMLGCLHEIKPSDPIVPPQLFDKSFFRQLRIEPYFQYSAEKHPDVAEVLHALCAELMSAERVISHADYTPKNFLVHDGHLILLDYEVAHIGHPAFDIASILNHFFLKATAFSEFLRDFLKASERFLEAYRERVGSETPDKWLWRCLGGLMLARVDGKSPVEYLVDEHKIVLRRTAKGLLNDAFHDLTGIYDPFL